MSNLPVARIGDATTGHCRICLDVEFSGQVTSGSPKTSADGIPIARLGDTVTASCGHTGQICTTSSKTSADGILIARIHDQFDGDYYGEIVAGSSKTTSV